MRGSYPENPFCQSEIKHGERKLSVGETGREKGVAEWSVRKSEERRSKCYLCDRGREMRCRERGGESVVCAKEEEKWGYLI